MDLTRSEKVYRTLCYLDDHGEGYAKQIAEEEGFYQGDISQVLNLLADSDLVEKSRRTRAQYYTLTEKGEEFLKCLDGINAYREMAKSVLSE